MHSYEYKINRPDMSMYDFFVSCKEKEFRKHFIHELKTIPYNEYYLRFPKMSYKNAHKVPFVLKIKKAPESLTRKCPNDTKSFEFHECTGDKKSIGFLSKSGRSYIVVPCPHNKYEKHYDSGHIAQFMKHGNIEYVHDFWKQIGDVFFHYFKKHSNRAFKLQTHGHDVYWLHAKFVFL